LDQDYLIDNLGNTAIGWGKTRDENEGIVNELNYVTVTNISNAVCQLSYGNTIFDTMVCVAGNYSRVVRGCTVSSQLCRENQSSS
jgi:hypothetical protein